MRLRCTECSVGPCTLDVPNCMDRTMFMDCPAAHDTGMDCGVDWEEIDGIE